MLHPSGTMGQGACGRGVLAKWLNHVTVGKPTFSQSYHHIKLNRSFGARWRFLRDTYQEETSERAFVTPAKPETA